LTVIYLKREDWRYRIKYVVCRGELEIEGFEAVDYFGVSSSESVGDMFAYLPRY
jgi:hypothetical protein